MMTVQPRTHLIPHVADKGFEQVVIIVHGAIDVPSSEKNDTKYYVTR